MKERKERYILKKRDLPISLKIKNRCKINPHHFKNIYILLKRNRGI